MSSEDEELLRLIEEDRAAEEAYMATSAEFVYAFYEAQEAATRAGIDAGEEYPALEEPELLKLVDAHVNAMQAVPDLIFDLDADGREAGKVLPDGIHLAEGATVWTLLHELAHWLDPDGIGHTKKWADTFVDLVARSISKSSGNRLRAEFAHVRMNP
jgi:hypothetical protein